MQVYLGSIGIGVGIILISVITIFFISAYLFLPQGIENGDLIQGQNRGEVYLIENDAKRHILKMSTFDDLGFSVESIKFVPDHIIDEIPESTPISDMTDLTK